MFYLRSPESLLITIFFISSEHADLAKINHSLISWLVLKCEYFFRFVVAVAVASNGCKFPLQLYQNYQTTEGHALPVLSLNQPNRTD